MHHHSSPNNIDHHEQQRVAGISVLAALFLVVIKLGAGIISGSLGLLAEALHSATDLVAALLTFIAVRVGQRPADRRHPFGHGRAEHLAALGEAMLLLMATIFIAVRAIERIVAGHSGIEIRSWIIVVAIVVIIVDLSRMTISHRAAIKYSSPALASNALHFASDLAGSIAVLIGLALVALGFEAGDALAALAVAIIVAVGAWRLLWDNAQVLMDVAPEAEERKAIRAVESLNLPLTLKRLRLRRSAGIFLVDVVVSVEPTNHVSQGHAIADSVEDVVKKALPGSDVVVHVEPDEASGTIRDKVTAAALSHVGIHEVHNVRVLLIDGHPEVSLHVKVQPDLRLDTAHDLADRVEEDIRTIVPELTHVDLHIEPVDRHASQASRADDETVLRAINQAVVDITGRDPVRVRTRDTPKGLTAYVTILAAADAPLRDAHTLATQVEERAGELAPQLSEIVVHTEPFES